MSLTSDIFSFNTDGKVKRFNYHKPPIFHFSGQWALINCTCDHQDDTSLCDQRTNVTLLFRHHKNAYFKQLSVGTEKTELVTRSVFNITHLAINDSGQYKCIIKTAFRSRNITITQKITVLRREGKTATFKLYLGSIISLMTASRGKTLPVSLREISNLSHRMIS